MRSYFCTRACVCALRSRTDKWNKQIHSGTYAHVLVEISRLSWILPRAISRSGKRWIFSAYIIERVTDNKLVPRINVVWDETK